MFSFGSSNDWEIRVSFPVLYFLALNYFSTSLSWRQRSLPGVFMYLGVFCRKAESFRSNEYFTNLDRWMKKPKDLKSGSFTVLTSPSPSCKALLYNSSHSF